MRPKYIAILGGALLVIGSLMPWGTLSAGILTRSFNGTDGDGIFTLAGGVLIALAALTGKDTPGERATAAGVLGLLAFLFTGYKMFSLGSLTTSASLDFQITLGTGIWICLVGSILAFAGGLARNPAAPASSPVANVQLEPSPVSADERLAKLADLKAKGLIDEAEYTAKRQQILNEI